MFVLKRHIKILLQCISSYIIIIIILLILLC